MEQSYSRIYRILHWTIAITFILIIITIFLRNTWLSKDNLAGIVENYFKDTDRPLSKDQSIALAKQIRAPMWQWHIYLGYVLIGLFWSRFIFTVLRKIRIQNPFNKTLSTKEKFQKWSYVVFYICVAISLFTGIFMENGPKEFKGLLKEIHVLSLYYLIPFIALHIGGILMAEFTNPKGIVSRMINGGSK